ncbi:DNA polymerase, partial [Xylella fastidiosa subsp. multiplex]|nr:DNA polymerase [Xylella fastidiosa subsp. multiplex]
FAYALGDGPVQVWDCTAPATMPEELSAALHNPAVLLYFHNSHFDRTVLRHCGINIPLERWRDSMAQAANGPRPGPLNR